MLNVISKKHPIVFFLSNLFVLTCIAYGNAAYLYLINLSSKDHSTSFLGLIVGLSTVFYLVVSYLSDIWSRKVILTFTLTLTTISLVCFYYKAWLLGAILYSLAPLTPVARASFCDIHITNDRAPNVIDTFIAESLPWMFVPILFHSNKSLYLSCLICGLILISASFFFKDWVDRGKNKFIFGIFEALKKYGIKVFLLILAAFAIVQISYKSLALRFASTTTIKASIVSSSFLMGAGFFLGTILARLIIRRNKVFMANVQKFEMTEYLDDYYKLIIFISISLIPFYLLISTLHWYLSSEGTGYLSLLLPGFTLLGGLFIPTMYAFFGSRVGYHALGVLYATIDIIDSIAELIGDLLQKSHYFRTDSHLVIIVVVLSFIAFLVMSTLTIQKK